MKNNIIVNASTYCHHDAIDRKFNKEWIEKNGYDRLKLMHRDGLHWQRAYGDGIAAMRELFKEYSRPSPRPPEVFPMFGMYNNQLEPSLAMELAVTDSEFQVVKERAQYFANKFRQEQVHLLRSLGPVPPQRPLDDGKLNYAWLIRPKYELNNLQHISRLIEDAGLSAFSCHQVGSILIYDELQESEVIPEKINKLSKALMDAGLIDDPVGINGVSWYAQLTCICGKVTQTADPEYVEASVAA